MMKRGRQPRSDGLKVHSLAARRRNGNPQITLTLPAQTLDLLDACAETMGCSRGQVITMALDACAVLEVDGETLRLKIG